MPAPAPSKPNAYCAVLGVDPPPDLALVKDSPEARTFSLFLAALMAEGGPLTLAQAAERFVAAGIGSHAEVERALRRCRPGRWPVYRHGDRYHLDPFDDEADLWAFRLGLRPSRGFDVDPALSREDAWLERERLMLERDREVAQAAARLRRAILRGWPPAAPRALAVLDVDTEHVARYEGNALEGATRALDAYDVLAGVEIRPLLEGLGVPFAGRRLHELRPPQATVMPEGGRKPLDVTLPRLLKGSCGITRAWKGEAALDALAARSPAKLLDALESEARDLAALYRYGRLHGVVRLRVARHDELIRVPWVGWDEWRINAWIEKAKAAGQPLEVVARGDEVSGDPWAGAQWVAVYHPPGYLPALVTAARELVQTDDVVRLRFACPGAWHASLPAEAAGPSTDAGGPQGEGVGRATEVAGPGGSGDARVLRVRVELDLEGEAPPVWRVIEVPEGASFWALHVAIQDAMGWWDSHLHAFELPVGPGEPPLMVGLPIGETWDDELEPLAGWTTPVLRYLGPERPECDYEYDFGDSWRHRIRLEAIAPRDPAATYPRCVDGARACPPEDVGGARGFAMFLEAIADPAHVEHASMLAWCGGAYDPEAFDAGAVVFEDPGERWVRGFGVG